MKPVLHVSGMFGALRHNIALVVPLAPHPINKNEVICYDLMADPQGLFDQTPETLGKLLYTRSDELPEGVERPGLKSIHINKCPIVVTAKMADAATAARLGISGDRCRTHLAALREFRGRDSAGSVAKIQAVYAGRDYDEVTDPDRMLYSGGFFSHADKRVMDQVREAAPEELASNTFSFEDKRLPEMLFRYRARNYPETLSEEEFAQWEEFRFLRLTDPDGGGSICMEEIRHLSRPWSNPES